MQPANNLHELRRRLYQRTELRAEALRDDERRRWHVAVFEAQDDPVLEIVEKITWSDVGATSLGLAGGVGVGKTTQIYRLIDELWDSHRIVGIRVGYEEYSSLSSPPDITDFLLSIAGGLAQEALEQRRVSGSWDKKRLDEQLVDLLKRLRFETSFTAGAVTITTSLREDDSFRRRLRAHLAGQVAQLVQEVRNFVSSVVVAINEEVADCRGVVLIVDSTDRLSGPGSIESEMQNAIRNLFIQNADNLSFEDLHSVYLLPPWLPITDGGALRLDTVVFPSIRVAKRDGRDEDEQLKLMEEMVRKRMPDVYDLISQEDLRELCRMSGGVQRVLFLLLKEVAGRARRATAPPVERRIIETAIDSVRQDYLAITVEAAPALQRIDKTKNVDGLEEHALAQLGRYFQAAVVLQVANGEKWYTIHPLMRRRLEAVSSLTS